MARLDYRAAQEELDPGRMARAMLMLLVKQINQLRGLHGLAPLSRDQVLAALKAEYRQTK